MDGIGRDQAYRPVKTTGNEEVAGQGQDVGGGRACGRLAVVGAHDKQVRTVRPQGLRRIQPEA